MTNQTLAWLPRKQKRLKDWREFTASEIQDAQVRKQSEMTLDSYAALLTQVWEANSANEEQLRQIDDLERQLEQLNEEARLRVVGKKRAK